MMSTMILLDTYEVEQDRPALEEFCSIYLRDVATWWYNANLIRLIACQARVHISDEDLINDRLSHCRLMK